MERRDGRLFIHSISTNQNDEHRAYEPKRPMRGGPDGVGAWAWYVAWRRQPPDPV